MGDENPIRTLGEYSKPSHEGYRNIIELPIGNNVDPNQHLKDILKLVDSLDLDGENKERTHLCLFQFSLCDQASNWLERLPAGSITTWEDLTTRFLAQLFPPGKTAKLRNDILMFQQHHEESLSEAWNHFKDLLQKFPHHGIDLWLQLHDQNAKESWALLEDLALYENESWNDPRDSAKPVKAIALPQDVPGTSDRCLIELENQVQRLMEAYLAPTQPTQVNKITTSCEVCSGPHETQYCMEDPEQAFVEYAFLHTDEAGGKWYTFKPEQNNLGDTYNPSWRSHPNLRWRQPQNSQNNFSNPPNRFQPNGSIPKRSFNNNPQRFNNQSNLKGLVSNFMASQDARLSKFEADFKQQQSEMTNKIDTVLKAITDQIAGTLPSDTVKNLKLSISSVQTIPTVQSTPSQSISSNKVTPMMKKQMRMRKKKRAAQKISMLTPPHRLIRQFRSSPKKSSNSIHSLNHSDWFLDHLTPRTVQLTVGLRKRAREMSLPQERGRQEKRSGVIFDEKKLGSSLEVSVDDSWRMI
ncbi:MAK10-like protein [Tanacetum coccineum]